MAEVTVCVAHETCAPVEFAHATAGRVNNIAAFVSKNLQSPWGRTAVAREHSAIYLSQPLLLRSRSGRVWLTATTPADGSHEDDAAIAFSA